MLQDGQVYNQERLQGSFCDPSESDHEPVFTPPVLFIAVESVCNLMLSIYRLLHQVSLTVPEPSRFTPSYVMQTGCVRVPRYNALSWLASSSFSIGKMHLQSRTSNSHGNDQEMKESRKSQSFGQHECLRHLLRVRLNSIAMIQIQSKFDCWSERHLQMLVFPAKIC